MVLAAAAAMALLLGAGLRVAHAGWSGRPAKNAPAQGAAAPTRGELPVCYDTLTGAYVCAGAPDSPVSPGEAARSGGRGFDDTVSARQASAASGRLMMLLVLVVTALIFVEMDNAKEGG